MWSGSTVGCKDLVIVQVLMNYECHVYVCVMCDMNVIHVVCVYMNVCMSCMSSVIQ